MGKLIVIEGLDASGKTTQSQLLLERLKKSGISAFGISLPNYDDDSSALVKMYLGGQFGAKPESVNAYAASTFYAVDRYASYKKYWSKEYNSDTVIIANRYTTSNACHQMTKLPPEQWDCYLNWLNDFEYRKLEIPQPDLVIFLDMPVDISQKLLLKRYNNDQSKKDVHERDTQYLFSCRRAAMYAAKALGWVTIPCAENGEPRSINEIANDIFAAVERKLLDD